jgi:GNAT superfamily N-acetyltransferase
MKGEAVEEVDVLETHDLRRRVLRPGAPVERLTYAGDRVEGAFHLGLRRDGTLVAVATFFPEPRGDRPAMRLRGMAVEPELQGSGAGRVLLTAALDRLRADGHRLLWAQARDTALGFYERLGFRIVGDGYVTAETGLPHHDIEIDL